MRTLINYLPLVIKKNLFKLKLYAKAPKLFFYSRSKFTMNSAPILLLSFPRSGSSWIGSILGNSEDTRYLREPITTSYMQTQKNRMAVFSKEKCDNWQEYNHYIEKTLLGKPTFTNSVIPKPKQWASPKKAAPVVIKEVNPLIIDIYIKENIKLIYLVRHPYAVAKSYSVLNWKRSDQLSAKLNHQQMTYITNNWPTITEQSFWFQIGFIQGWSEALAKAEIELANHNSKTTIIRYEDICANPIEEFSRLFKFCNISFFESARLAIELSLSGKSKIGHGDFSLIRNKEEVTLIKVSKEEAPHLKEVMTAYKQGFNAYFNYKEEDCELKPSYDEHSEFIQLLE